jgi:hypothetical protein
MSEEDYYNYLKLSLYNTISIVFYGAAKDKLALLGWSLCRKNIK